MRQSPDYWYERKVRIATRNTLLILLAMFVGLTILLWSGEGDPKTVQEDAKEAWSVLP